MLRVFRVAYKYCAILIERRARALTIELTRPSAIRSHLTAELDSLSVVKAGHLLECEEALNSAWGVAMAEFRDETRGIAEMINAAEFVGRNEMIGEAYYATMIRGQALWSQRDSELSSEQLHNLWVGTAKCVEAMEFYEGEWESQAWTARSQPHQSFLSSFSKKCFRNNIRKFDLLGRLQTAIAISRDHPGPYGTILVDVEKWYEIEKGKLWVYFQDELRHPAPWVPE